MKPENGQALLYDKILHTHLDENHAAKFSTAKAIFLLRSSSETIASITRLFADRPQSGFSTVAQADRYYVERVERLAVLYERFPPQNRLIISFDDLVDAPDTVLQTVAAFLQLRSPLRNHYQASPDEKGSGRGDPDRVHTLQRISRQGVRSAANGAASAAARRSYAKMLAKAGAAQTFADR